MLHRVKFSYRGDGGYYKSKEGYTIKARPNFSRIKFTHIWCDWILRGPKNKRLGTFTTLADAQLAATADYNGITT